MIVFLSRRVCNFSRLVFIYRPNYPKTVRRISSVVPRNSGILISQSPISYRNRSTMAKGNLSKVVSKLNEHMPPSLAEAWDNVGLLVEPSDPHNVSKILLTNDLTPEVLDEAIDSKANFILSYHPPIFSPLKRLCQEAWKQKIVVRAIENRIAIYAPHTSCDTLKGGVNDWLLSAFDNASMSPVTTKDDPSFLYSHRVTLTVDGGTSYSGLVENLKGLDNIVGLQIFKCNESFGQENMSISFLCKKSSLQAIAQVLVSHSVQNPVFTEVAKPPLADAGIGRISKLNSSLSLTEAVEIVKKHLKLPHVRVATAHGPKFSSDEKNIHTIAVCAGAGSSVLRGVKADLYITGEMTHHGVLDAIHNGACVILCEHSNTERGYLTELKDTLVTLLSDYHLEVCVSQIDADPLKTV